MEYKHIVTQEYIDNLFIQSEKDTFTVYNNCLVMVCRLPNGFIIIENSICTDPVNYSPEIEWKTCEKKIKDKLWELEEYRLQYELGAK